MIETAGAAMVVALALQIHAMKAYPQWLDLLRRAGLEEQAALLPAQAAQRPGQPSMALATQVEALRVLLRTALAGGADLRESGGQLH